MIFINPNYPKPPLFYFASDKRGSIEMTMSVCQIVCEHILETKYYVSELHQFL